MGRVLVTGGSGFIGSALVGRLLAEGHRVDVIDNLSTGALGYLSEARAGGGEFSFHQLDVRSPDVVELIAHRRPGIIWHLAGQASVATSLSQPAYDADVNVVGTLRVLEGARAAGQTRKVVVASSAGAVFGDVDPSALPIRDHHPRRPTSPHGVAKHAVDSYLPTMAELFGIEFTSLVIGSVYGPRPGAPAGSEPSQPDTTQPGAAPPGAAAGEPGGVIGRWARQLAAGQPCAVSGDGTQTRDFVYLDDVVDALARAGERADGLVLNIGTGIATSLIDVYRLLCTLFAEQVPDLASSASAPPALVHGPARPGEVTRSSLDSTRASVHLDWRPWTTLADGARAVVANELRRHPGGLPGLR